MLSGIVVTFLLLIESSDCYNACGANSRAVKVPQCGYTPRRVCRHHGRTDGKCREIRLPEASSRYTSNITCIYLEKSYYEGHSYIILQGCPGLLTGRKNQPIKGICTNQDSPFTISNLYLTIQDTVPGQYYFDCHLLDGSTISRELVVYNKKNIFEKMVILVNGEIRSDANNLVENDTVLIIFRIVGMSKEQITVTPPCLFNIAVRSGCIHGGNFCDPEYNPPNLAFSWMYYFRPVLMSDDGLTISFTDRSGTRIYGSVTLNVHPRAVNDADPSCLPYSYKEFVEW